MCLVKLMKQFSVDLKNDEKIKVIDKQFIYLRWLTYTNNDIIKLKGVVITRSDVFEYVRLKVLSILFIKNIWDKIEAYKQWLVIWDDEFVRAMGIIMFTEKNFLAEQEKYSKEILDTNEIYLYSDSMGKIITENLKDIKKNENPVKHLLNIIVNIHINITDKYCLLFTCFSLIKKDSYKDSKLEQIKEMKDISEVLDFIVNSNFDKNYHPNRPGLRDIIEKIEQFQYWLKEGYINPSDLEDILEIILVIQLHNFK